MASGLMCRPLAFLTVKIWDRPLTDEQQVFHSNDYDGVERVGTPLPDRDDTQDFHFDREEEDPWASGRQPRGQPVDETLRWWVAGAIGMFMIALFFIWLMSRDDPAGFEPTISGSPTETPATLPDNTGESTPESPFDPVSVTIAETVPPAECTGGARSGQPLQDFINAALSQKGKPYQFQAPANVDDPNPSSFSSSTLVNWAANRAGVKLSGPTWHQYLDLADCSSTVSVAEALTTPGALIFGFGTQSLSRDEGPPGERYVVISLGDGTHVIDARRSGGIGVFDQATVVDAVDGRHPFSHAAVVPDFGRGDATYNSN